MHATSIEKKKFKKKTTKKGEKKSLESKFHIGLLIWANANFAGHKLTQVKS